MKRCEYCKGRGSYEDHLADYGRTECVVCDARGFILPNRDDKGRFRKDTREEWLRSVLLDRAEATTP